MVSPSPEGRARRGVWCTRSKAAIEKRAAQGKISKVEKVTENGNVTYEAAISGKGKKSEVEVDKAGSLVK